MDYSTERVRSPDDSDIATAPASSISDICSQKMSSLDLSSSSVSSSFDTDALTAEQELSPTRKSSSDAG